MVMVSPSTHYAAFMHAASPGWTVIPETVRVAGMAIPESECTVGMAIPTVEVSVVGSGFPVLLALVVLGTPITIGLVPIGGHGLAGGCEQNRSYQNAGNNRLEHWSSPLVSLVACLIGHL